MKNVCVASWRFCAYGVGCLVLGWSCKPSGSASRGQRAEVAAAAEESAAKCSPTALSSGSIPTEKDTAVATVDLQEQAGEDPLAGQAGPKQLQLADPCASVPGTGSLGAGEDSGSPYAYGREELQQLPLYKLQYMELDLAQRRRSDLARLTLFDQIATGLCQKLLTRRAHCISAKPIYDYRVDTISCFYDQDSRGDFAASCMEQADQKPQSSAEEVVFTTETCTLARVAPRVEVVVTGAGSEDLVLVVNDAYVSKPFAPGTKAIQVQFQPKQGATDVRPIDWNDVYDLTLRRAAAGGTLPLETARIDLKVDGMEVVQGRRLEKHSKLSGAYVFGFHPRVLREAHPSCEVDALHIAEFKAQKRAAVEGAAAQENLQSYIQATRKLDPQHAVEEVEAEKARVVEQIEAYKFALQENKQYLTAKRNQIAQLEAPLVESTLQGCHASAAIESLRIQFHGTAAAPELVDPKARVKYYPDVGVPNTYQLDLGVVTVETELAKLLDKGYVYPGALDAVTIGSFDRLKVRKVATQFINDPFPCKDGSGFIANIEKLVYDPTCYKVSEADVFTLSGVTVWMNELVVYDNTQLAHKFDRDEDLWLTHPMGNPAWQQLMQRRDCASD
ncbi:MAG: hypothetical protein OXT67_13510 [Zetaproteobacteria bacterium]|nr:hypothetical protein [Zetaproteobacteria bacterium]